MGSKRLAGTVKAGGLQPGRGAAAAVAMLALALCATTARAGDVDLKGSQAWTSGSSKLVISDFGTCTDFLALSVSFSPEKRKFTAVDDDGRTYKGKYSQSGTDGRKISVRFSSKSKKKLTSALETFVEGCTGASHASAEIDQLKITGKINKSFDALKVKGRVEGHGQADGQSGDATYTFKSVGPLVLVGGF